jgi:hypothetical protein
MEKTPEEREPIDVWDRKVKNMNREALIDAYKASKQISGTDIGSESDPEGEWMLFLKREMNERGLTQYL